MRIAVRNVGNSTGIIIPRPVLKEMGLAVGDDIDAQIQDGALVLRPTRNHPRAGWEQAAKTIAESGDDELAWPEFTNSEDTDLEW